MAYYSAFILLLFLLCLTKTFAKTTEVSALNTVSAKKEVKASQTLLMLELLKSINSEKNYEAIYLEGCKNVSSLEMDLLIEKLAIPVVLLDENSEFYWKRSFNSDILVVKCLWTASNDLKSLASKLQHMRQTRIIILAELNAGNELNIAQLALIFKRCEQLQLLNIIILLKDWQQTNNFHTYKKFPNFHLIQREMGIAHQKYFTYSLTNILGYPLYTLPDQNRPRTILYENAKGQQQLSGYIGKLMQCFASKLNATLKYPFPVHIGTNASHIDTLLAYTRSGLLDIGMGLGGSTVLINPQEFSLPVEIAKWMVMLPMEAPLEIDEMFSVMLTSRLFQLLFGLACLQSLVLTLCHYWLLHTSMAKKHCFWELLLQQFENSFRGILGQAFPLNKSHTSRKILLICVLIFITALLTSTSCGAYLNTYFTHQPNRVRINTFDDLLQSKLKILLATQELKTLKVCRGLEFYKKYESTFELTTSWQEFLQRRSSLYTTHAYPVTTSLWHLIQKQQASFQRKLFRLSPDMWFEEVVYFGLPLQENSIYRDPLNWFILQLHQAGLLQYWRTATFYDMVANGMMSFKDLSTGRSFHVIVLQDFYSIFLILVYAMLLSLCVFIAEILIHELRMRKKC